MTERGRLSRLVVELCAAWEVYDDTKGWKSCVWLRQRGGRLGWSHNASQVLRRGISRHDGEEHSEKGSIGSALDGIEASTATAMIPIYERKDVKSKNSDTFTCFQGSWRAGR